MSNIADKEKGKVIVMDINSALNELLVKTFRNINEIEERAIRTIFTSLKQSAQEKRKICQRLQRCCM